METNSMEQPPHSTALDAAELRLLGAMADRIFPPTDTPGAVEIGAVDYAMRALAGDYAECLPVYHEGLAAIERRARGRFGKNFGELGNGEKDAVLGDFESGRVAEFSGAADFFETVPCHVLEGVFGEPHYGGNRDLAGWRIVNFPGQQ